MSQTLLLVRSPLTASLWERIDRSCNLVALGDRATAGIDVRVLERLCERKAMLAVFIDGEAPGCAVEAGLVADLLAVPRGASLDLTQVGPIGMAGLVWRLGRGTIPWLAMHDGPVDDEALVRDGIVDLLVPEGNDPLEWFPSWVGNRSLAALSSAARLIRAGGGDATERAEFARLFAAAVPREGLSAFLERRPPTFEDELSVETI